MSETGRFACPTAQNPPSCSSVALLWCRCPWLVPARWHEEHPCAPGVAISRRLLVEVPQLRLASAGWVKAKNPKMTVLSPLFSVPMVRRAS